MDNLRYIRDAMERSAAFTAVPGGGGVAMGLSAVVAAFIANRQTTAEAWMCVWLAEAAVAFAIGFFAIRRKARAAGMALLRGPGRKFALGMLPAMTAGAVFTAALYRVGHVELMPGAWMLLYGAAVVAGGAYSVRPVPTLGFCLMAVGAVTLFIPFAWADTALGLGFGGLHIAFGAVIARRYGG